MSQSLKGFLIFFILAVVVIAIFGNYKVEPAPPEATIKIFKDKLVPDRILSVTEADDPKDTAVGIMAGVDDDHLVYVSIYRSQVLQGFQTSVPVEVVAYNGRDILYINNPKTFNTEVLFIINSLDRKLKRASITISGRLVSTNPDDRSYLDIVPVTLPITGKQFDNLVANK